VESRGSAHKSVEMGRGGGKKSVKAAAPELSHEDIYDAADDYFKKHTDLDDEYISLTSSGSKANGQRFISLHDDDVADSDDNDGEDEDIKEAMREEEAITAAWGKKKNLYYDHDVKGLSKKSDEIEREEEEEVKRMRSERLALLEDDLYEDDMLGSLIAKQKLQKIDVATGAAPLVGFEAMQSGLISSKDEVTVEKVKKDLSNFSVEEKLEYLEESKPELFELLDEFEEKKQMLDNEVQPILDLIESRFPNGEDDAKFPSQFYQLLVTRKRLLLSFCGNVTFCLMLIAKGKSLTDHPVAQSMLKLDDLLNLSAKAVNSQEDVLRRLVEEEEDEVMQIAVDNEDVQDNESSSEADAQSPIDQSEDASADSDEEDQVDSFEKKHSLHELVQSTTESSKDDSATNAASKLYDYIEGSDADEEEFAMLKEKRPVKKTLPKGHQNLAHSDVDEDEFGGIGSDHGEVESDEPTHEESHVDVEGEEEESEKTTAAGQQVVVGPARPDPDYIEGRRKITRTIMKNQGLKRYRKKENKNPRLKHRNKYEKAIKKHRKLVKEYQGQVSNYGGEETGIKPYLVKATRVP
jgi:U3 small nucleolar RNA-associated protein 3